MKLPPQIKGGRGLRKREDGAHTFTMVKNAANAAKCSLKRASGTEKS